MLETYFNYAAVLDRLRQGPLSGALDDIADKFTNQGYARLTAVRYLSLLGSFNRYAKAAGCDSPQQINEELMMQFLKEFRKAKSTLILLKTALNHLSNYLNHHYPKAAQLSVSIEPDEQLLINLEFHLKNIRGLQPGSRSEILRLGLRMLKWYRVHRSDQTLSQLSGKDVLDFVAIASQQCKAASTRSQMVSHVRNFLRYLHWEGILENDISHVVPRTPCWRLARVPNYLTWRDVLRVIDAIDARTAIGKRDRAILLLLATTGLRNKEVRLLQLQDIHWRTGEVHIRETKSRREHRVPLLEETGSALAEYVLEGRPTTTDSTIFLCHRPPVRPLGCSGTLSFIVKRRLADCGIRPAHAGAHLIRHSLATRMVQQDRSIKEVADLLGHRHIDTTAIYVKVALSQLLEVALPFPGGLS